MIKSRTLYIVKTLLLVVIAFGGTNVFLFRVENRFDVQMNDPTTLCRLHAKSYFRGKFIALTRIETSFPDELNKEVKVKCRRPCTRRSTLASVQNNSRAIRTFYTYVSTYVCIYVYVRMYVYIYNTFFSGRPESRKRTKKVPEI